MLQPDRTLPHLGLLVAATIASKLGYVMSHLERGKRRKTAKR